jgi:hypothetical protein
MIVRKHEARSRPDDDGQVGLLVSQPHLLCIYQIILREKEKHSKDRIRGAIACIRSVHGAQ